MEYLKFILKFETIEQYNSFFLTYRRLPKVCAQFFFRSTQLTRDENVEVHFDKPFERILVRLKQLIHFQERS